MSAIFNSIKDYDTEIGDGRKAGTTLIFPQDMEKKFYPEAIKFSIYERHGVNYDEIKKLAKSAYETGGNFLKAEADIVRARDNLEDLQTKIAAQNKAIKEIDEEKRADSVAAAQRKITKAEAGIVGEELKNSAERRDNATEKIEDISEKMIEKMKEAREAQTLEKTQDRHLQSIYLAMPESVNFAEGVEWQGTDLGVVGGVRSGALNMDNGLDYGVLTGAGAALGGAAGLGASMIPGISGIAGTVLGAVLGNNSLQSGIESTFGVKTNPFKEQTLQGVGFRPFDFTFRFIARSQGDVNVIQDILRAFRSYSKPTFKEGSNGTIFKYPKEFRIEFLTIDENNTYVTNEYLPEIKFCICQTVNTNFTAAGWKSFEGGAPTDITVQMTFQETEIITGEDVNGETEIGRFAEYGGNF